jgi:hypothetical protein
MHVWHERLTTGDIRPYLPAELPAAMRVAFEMGWASDPVERCNAVDIMEAIEQWMAVLGV